MGPGPASIPARHEEDGHAAYRRQRQLPAQCPATGEPQQRSYVQNRRHARSGQSSIFNFINYLIALLLLHLSGRP